MTPLEKGVHYTVVITGSYNYTTNATKFNDENLLIIKDKNIAWKFTLEWQRLTE